MTVQNLAVHNSIVIANIGQLIKAIVSKIAGNDISTAINGSKATAEVVHSLVKQRLRSKLESIK
jgi:hypothetical protein